MGEFRVEWVVQTTVGVQIGFGRDFFRNPFLLSQLSVRKITALFRGFQQDSEGTDG